MSTKATETRKAKRERLKEAMAEASERWNARKAADTSKARLFFKGGQVIAMQDDASAYAAWLSFRSSVKVALRGIGDATPVYSHDYV